jgi:predicted PurR-regulated permease PerM
MQEDSGVRRISWRLADVARVFALAVLFLFLWRFFWMVHQALFLGLAAILLAIVIHAPAAYLARWIPFRVAFALVVLALFGGIAVLAINVVPQVVDQTTQLVELLPDAITAVADWIRERTAGAADAGVAQRLSTELAQFLGRFVPLAVNVISFAFGSFAVLFLAIFLAAQPDTYRALVLRMIPAASRARWTRLYDEAGRMLRNWVIAKALTMLAVGLFTTLGLKLFGIPNALALGALAGLLELIPNFGPTIAAAPAIVSAFLLSPMTALYVTIYYIVLQQVQNAITVPLVERRAVDIPPAALLIWQLMLAVGFGFLALFVATPLLAVLVVAVRLLYLEPSEQQAAQDRREADA